jgi:putative transposase
MAWRASGVVDQRNKFVEQCESGEWNMAELCRIYEISRQSGYKWLKRGREQGEAGFADFSRASHHHPNQTSAKVEQQIIALRRQHPSWGPRKLHVVLRNLHPKTHFPAVSTIGALLKREGLVVVRKQRRKTPPYTQPLEHAKGANDLWCADFKGWFLTRDQQRIDPLTISDAATRYLLRCQAVHKTDTEHVLAIFQAAFREFGLPLGMRTDNGPPFASRAIAGLSPLSVYWMKLGIVPERIRPGHPEQNGRHERMHRTLKAETATPPAANRRQQQYVFDRFQDIYNGQRPHEAIAMHTPASCYIVSPRPLPAKIPLPEYPSSWTVRTVRACGRFGWKNQDVFISETLRNERIGLQPVEEDWWLIHFATFPIALFDSHTLCVQPLPEQGKPEDEDGNDESGESCEKQTTLSAASP